MAEPQGSDPENAAVGAAVGKSRKLAARIPRLILEARRVAFRSIVLAATKSPHVVQSPHDRFLEPPDVAY